jgi:transcription elongation factor Elf1
LPHHGILLDDLGEKVPQNGRTAVMAAREDSMKGNMKALRDLASKDPEKAAEIAMSIANGRANVATKAASDGHDKEALKAIDDVNAYKNLVDEIKATKQPKEHDAGEKQDGKSKKTP